MKVALASGSEVKRWALIDNFEDITPEDVLCYPVEIEMAEQPMNGAGETGAKLRLEKMLALAEKSAVNVDVWVAIENSIIQERMHCFERCDIVTWCPSMNQLMSGHCQVELYDTVIPYIYQAMMATPVDYKYKEFGLSETVGSFIKKDFKERGIKISADNWIGDFCDEGNRSKQIATAFESIYLKVKTNLVCRISKDWPKKGVNFVDISPFLYENRLFNSVMDRVAEKFYEKIDVIVGLDARGFVFGAYLSAIMKLPFVMIRKTGKLPPAFSTNYNYEKEYGKDSFSIPRNIIQSGQRCLLVDDVLATGGSLFAAARLVEVVGGKVAGMWVLATIPELKEKAQATLEGYHVESFL